MMVRRIIMLASLLIVVSVAACGDDDTVADPERFCEVDAEIEQLGDPLDLPPDEARDMVDKARGLLDEAARVAPEEIRPSFEIAANEFIRIADFFEAANFDPAQMDEVELEALFEAAFSGESAAAVEAWDMWVSANCST